MEKSTTPFSELMLHIQKEILIMAPLAVVFESVLEQMGPGMDDLGGNKMDMKFEAWPGGRWYRDLGNKTGHLWGHVQVIKPPTLLEIYGPMMMSYPAVNHIQYRLTPEGDGTKLTFLHRGMGDILPDHRSGMVQGWEKFVSLVKTRSEK